MQLRRDDVLRGALELLDVEGLDGLTMRKLGDHLGVRHSGLHWHFKTKRDLLDAMAEALVKGVGDELPDAAWDVQITTLAHRLRAALIARRDGARTVAGTYVADQATIEIGRVGMEALCCAGFESREAVVALTVIGHYVLGHTIEEQAWSALTAAERENKLDKAISVNGEIGRVVHDAFLGDPVDRFGYGLSALVEGLRSKLEQTKRRA